MCITPAAVRDLRFSTETIHRSAAYHLTPQASGHALAVVENALSALQNLIPAVGMGVCLAVSQRAGHLGGLSRTAEAFRA